jgi:hypothetical protein
MDENVEWQNKLKKASRSIKFSIYNQTERQLRLIHSSLRQGKWVNPPPNFIDVNQKVDFGASKFSFFQNRYVPFCLGMNNQSSSTQLSCLLFNIATNCRIVFIKSIFECVCLFEV